MENQLEQLKKWTTIVIDTGDIESIARYAPRDATTNPSLIFLAAQKKEYASLVRDAISFSKTAPKELCQQWLIDKLFVNFGIKILELIKGRVSTEVDARLSFDVQGSIAKAKHLIQLYEQAGIDRSRILIKLASTWEGIRAAVELEKEGIHCNMTLLFSLVQAAACAEAGVTLISPFVGRILDWHKKASGVAEFAPDKDPGVLSVRAIYYYYQTFGYKTEIMGASFRNTGEILELAGCNLLTIAPDLMQQLVDQQEPIQRKLSHTLPSDMIFSKLPIDEKHFRWGLNEDQMATEKLSEGIRKFAADTVKLEAFIAGFVS